MDISGVKNGIVIDHIKAGKSMQIYDLLGLGKIDNTVALIKNASSEKYGKKDIIKIDEVIDLDIVEDNRLAKKLHMELPEKLVNVVKCKNPRCITSVEQEIVHEFRLVDKEKKIYRCCYCDAEHRVK